MKKILFSLLLLISCTFFSFAQEKCSQYKDGTFRLRDPQSNAFHYIERRGNRQYEEIEGEDTKHEFEVIWLSDCIYTLHPTKETIALLKVDFTLTVEIIEIKEKSLVLKMHIKDIENSDMMMEMEIIKPL